MSFDFSHTWEPSGDGGEMCAGCTLQRYPCRRQAGKVYYRDPWPDFPKSSRYKCQSKTYLAPDYIKRNTRIFELVIAGQTFVKTAGQFDLSASRVGEIFKQQCYRRGLGGRGAADNWRDPPIRKIRARWLARNEFPSGRPHLT